MSKVLFESTTDGSHTLYVPELDEHYHSINGAIQESMHVFINAGLKHIQKQHINILEVGFGTGLNALLSLNNQEDKIIYYHTYELYPLPYSIIKNLNYINLIDVSLENIFLEMHRQEWGEILDLTQKFKFKKNYADFSLMDQTLNIEFDLIYFDAFAPNKQPEMWTQDIFDYIYSKTATSGILVTYCAKGEVRRMLQRAGYRVERIPGPQGKREMLRAIKNKDKQ